MDLIMPLESGANRPIIKLDYMFSGCNALLDTGALFPVWTKDTELLTKLGAKLVKQDISFGGFGGKAKGDLYKITFELKGHDSSTIIYPDMDIIASQNEKIPGYFILSATMFNAMIYTIDNVAKKFMLLTPDNQVCFHLKIIDNNGNLHVLCNT